MTDRNSDDAGTQAIGMSDEHWGFVFEGSGIGLWDWNVATNSVRFYGGWKDIFGYGQDQGVGRLDEGSYPFHPDDRPKFMAALQQCLQDETPMFDSERRMRCKDGSYKWVVERNKIISRTPDGKPLRVIGTYTDITERKDLERRLTLQHEVANVLAGSVSGMDDAIAAILQPVCEALGWDEGLLWVVDESTQRLRCHATWCTPVAGVGDYGSASRGMTFLSGVGLPGRVWASAKPAWIADVTRDENFPRAALAEQAGFHAAAAFPVKLADRVHAVLEFFHHDAMPADPSLLITFQAVADQLSQLCSRKRTEEESLKRETLFSLMLNTGPSCIKRVAADGTLLHMNPAGLHMIEACHEKDAIGRCVFDLVVSEHRASFIEMHQSVIEGSSRTFQFEIIGLQGTRRWMETYAVPFRSPVTDHIEHLAVTHDITERKRTEALLQSSEEKLRQALKASNVGLWDWNTVTNEVRFSREWKGQLGYEEVELPDSLDTWEHCLHSDDRARAIAYAQGYIACPEGDYQQEFRLRHKDGTYRWIEARASFVAEPDGRRMRLLGAHTDITERKRAEENLRKSEARLKEAQRLAHIGSWELDLTTNRLDWSDEIYRIFEIDRHSFGASYEAFLSAVHPDDRSAVNHAYTESVRNKNPYEIMHRLLMPDGRIKYVQERCETIYDAEGKPQRSFGTVQDVTERMRLAEREAARLEQLKKLSELGLTLSGDPSAIFERIVRMIGDLFNVRVVCLSEIVGHELHFKAVYLTGEVVRDAGRCPLAVTPCATVERDKDLRLFDRVMERFPQASFLRDHQAVSYCGFPALDGHGRVVAVTCLLDDKPREFTAEEQELLRVFGQRIAIELERARYLAEQQRHADELQRSHAFIRQIIDTAPNFIFAKDREGRFTVANQAVAQAYGTTVENLLGKTDADFNPDQSEVEFFRRKDLQVMDSLQEWSTPEEKITDATGTVRWLQTVKRPILNEQGAATMVLGVATDVTERKRVEGALRASETRLRLTLEIATDGLWDWDLTTCQAHYSSSWIRLLGLEQEKIPLDNISDWKTRVHPDDRPWVEQALNDHLEGKTAGFVIEHRVCHKSGEWKWFAMRGKVTRWNEEGRPVCMMGVMTDITERRLSDAALAQAAQELAKKNRQLEEARDNALDAAKVKAEFLATMSHEIRTPMNGIIGMTGLLLDTVLSDEQREYADMVRRSGEHLLDIINDILDFSKIEAGKLDLEHLDFDVRTTVEDTLALVAERAYAQGLELACLVQADVPTGLHGDPGRLRQVLINLLGNAIKFTERGDVVLTVSLADDDEAGRSEGLLMKFEVTDSGVGLTPAQRAKLFQPFVQADGSTTRKFGGTGLGLAICKKLVETMGGQIGVDSTAGMGSTFWFTVRCAVRTGDVRQASPIPASLQGSRTLIVDDHPLCRQTLEHQLRAKALAYKSAAGGAQALDLLRNAAERGEPFDLAILDLQMPDMDGLELARRIKAESPISSTRLILLASLGRRGDAKAAQAAGIAAYLTKPIRQSQLYECLSLVLANSPHAESGVAQPPAPLITRHSLSEAQAQSRGRILVAEDNPVNQKVAVKMIEKLGYRVDVAGDGREAVEALERIPYALVFMDCHMPVMDGFQATHAIRRREAGGRRTPIVAMTANAMHEDREQCLKAGMDDFLSKPVASKSLAETLNRWLPHDTSLPEPESRAA